MTIGAVVLVVMAAFFLGTWVALNPATRPEMGPTELSELVSSLFSIAVLSLAAAAVLWALSD